MVPVVRQETLDAHPDLKGVLDSLADKLDDATMQKLNGEVDVERKSISDVATEFLKAQGLL
jgi:osmoprotectant transport system substrate-binding protein